MPKKCDQCGADIAPGAAFCTNCGSKAPEEVVVVRQPEEEPVKETVKEDVCMKCGSVLADGAAFCTSCGTPRGAAPTESPVSQPQPQPQPQYVQEPSRQQYTQPAQQYAQPQYFQPHQQTVYASPQAVPASASDKTDKVVGTGAYFWLMFLYALPVIGFLVCLIMGFAAKNKNLKHFARAILIWVLVGLIISAIISIAVYFLIGSLGDLAGLDLGSLFEGFGIGGFGG